MARFKPRLRPLILTIIMAVTIIEIVILSPSSVEQDSHDGAPTYLDPEDVVSAVTTKRPILAPDIPIGQIPDYAITGFNYISARGDVKQWKMRANTANMYNREELVHAIEVKAFLFNPDGRPTLVTGREARYYMDARDLEIYGNVETTFPDGFVLHSEYLRYKPGERTIEIPPRLPVKGAGKVDDQKRIEFESNGLDYSLGENQIVLPQQVTFIMERLDVKSGAPNERTKIVADHCEIDRKHNIAYFRMNLKTPDQKRYVHITQPSLFVRGRWVELNYGDFTDIVNYMVVHEDVFIQEKTSYDVLRYATCGQADFDTNSNIIVLTKFPQVYENADTVTGDKITIDRDKDVVEVKHSNAFSSGTGT